MSNSWVGRMRRKHSHGEGLHSEHREKMHGPSYLRKPFCHLSDHMFANILLGFPSLNSDGPVFTGRALGPAKLAPLYVMGWFAEGVPLMLTL